MSSQSLQNFDIQAFQKQMLSWYDENKRQLPWRKTKDPYKIWVSEIMLQQTQVNTVIPYFKRFMTKFPTVYHLAAADEQTVLKMWEGLGYYSRARHLHEAAKDVVNNYGGEIPRDPKQLGRLKGIGPYTKGAILSIAFDQVEPAIDGNVMRVISRILKIEEDITKYQTKKLFDQYVRRIIPAHNPSAFNQSLMELGALVCTPKEPMCLLCPVQQHCLAFSAGIERDLPIKTKNKPQKTIPYVVLLITNDQDEIVIEKRPKSGLLANMWQFPMVPLNEIGFAHLENWLYAEYGLNVSLHEQKGTLKHIFTHLIWDMEIYTANTTDQQSSDRRIRFVKANDLETLPFPVPHLKVMKYLPNKS